MSDTKQLDTTGFNLHQKLAKITGEIGKIDKTGQSSGYGDRYNFIEYAAVAGRLRELFAKYGVVIVPYMQKARFQQRVDVQSAKGNKGQHVLVDFTFVVTNADKPDDKFSVSWTGEATDFGDKATNKAATSALKYYLMRQFNISEKGDDPDSDTPQVAQSFAPAASNANTNPPTSTTPKGEGVTRPQLSRLFMMMKGKGVHDREVAKGVLHLVAGVDSLTTLTKSEASSLIEVVHELADDEVNEAVKLAEQAISSGGTA